MDAPDSPEVGTDAWLERAGTSHAEALIALGEAWGAAGQQLVSLGTKLLTEAILPQLDPTRLAPDAAETDDEEILMPAREAKKMILRGLDLMDRGRRLVLKHEAEAEPDPV